MSNTQSTTEVAAPKTSEFLLNDKWDLILSNTVVKTGLGLGGGIIASVLFFKRRAWPVWIGTGFGLGRGYAEGDATLRTTPIRFNSNRS